MPHATAILLAAAVAVSPLPPRPHTPFLRPHPSPSPPAAAADQVPAPSPPAAPAAVPLDAGAALLLDPQRDPIVSVTLLRDFHAVIPHDHVCTCWVILRHSPAYMDFGHPPGAQFQIDCPRGTDVTTVIDALALRWVYTSWAGTPPCRRTPAQP